MRAAPSLRPKLSFHDQFKLASGNPNVSPKHGSYSTYARDLLNITINIMFLSGSICFFSNYPSHIKRNGDWLFIIGSVLQFALATEGCVEYLLAKDVAWSDVEKRDEFVEVNDVWISSLLFLAASIMFMPGFHVSGWSDELQGEVGAFLFIWGSLGFVEANFWTSMALSAHEGRLGPPHGRALLISRLMCLGLYFTTFGACLFTVGSFLYRPSYDYDCGVELSSTGARYGGLQQEAVHKLVPDDFHLASTRRPLTSVADNGTWMYVAGSSCFLIQSLIKLSCTVLQHTAPEPTETSELLNDLDADFRKIMNDVREKVCGESDNSQATLVRQELQQRLMRMIEEDIGCVASTP